MRRVVSVLFSVLIMVLGTGTAFAAETAGEAVISDTYSETENSAEPDNLDIKDDSTDKEILNGAESSPADANTDSDSETATEPASEATERVDYDTADGYINLGSGETQSFAAVKSEEPFKKINEERVSEDGNYKIKVYRDKKTAYADIIKYIGRDKFKKNLTIHTIDGFEVRRIKSKAFSKLESLKKVTFIGSDFGTKGRSTVYEKAFFNCPNLEQFTVNSFVKIEEKGVGYFKNKPSENFKTLVFDDKTDTKNDLDEKLVYTYGGGFSPVFSVSSDKKTARKQVIKTFLNGKKFKVKLDGKSAAGWKSSNPEVISIKKKGTATILAKGKTTLSLKTDNLTVKRVIEVKTNPYLSVKGKKTSSVKVKNGSTVRLNVIGKAAAVDNVYTSTAGAQIVSDASADEIEVKGLKTGSTKLTVTVNGVGLKLSVTVKKNPIDDTKMANIAAKIGRQTNYYYASSTVMCSAYSYAYAYKQVTGITRTAGSFWCPGGCTWEGGTYTHYGSSASMLKAIKTSIDNNKSCVGLLSVGASSQHYVTFYGYTGSGTSLSDFKLLDPWDGNLTTGAGYGYSYGYHVVTVNA